MARRNGWPRPWRNSDWKTPYAIPGAQETVPDTVSLGFQFEPKLGTRGPCSSPQIGDLISFTLTSVLGRLAIDAVHDDDGQWNLGALKPQPQLLPHGGKD